jgi:hypothetical protein
MERSLHINLRILASACLIVLLTPVSCGHAEDHVPPPAAAVGYGKRTFGPTLIPGKNWYRFSFFGTKPETIPITRNADGSITINPGGNDYRAGLSTASVGTRPDRFTGTAFGGGGYFQVTMSFTDQAAFWANDIESMNGESAGGGPNQWPGQPRGYGDMIEPDFAEFLDVGVYGFAMHNWYGVVGSKNSTDSWDSGSPAHPAGASYTKPNRYGFLWVPATATTRGYAKWFFNDVQVGNTMTWNQYDPSRKPPPSEKDGTAYSVMDKLHLALILGAGSKAPIRVYSVDVWQASSANNMVKVSN